MITELIFILKLIGIILLSLLGILLLLLLAVLFVPFRYKINASVTKELFAKANISWLLHIINITAVYQGEANIILRIFGIPFYNMRKAEEKAAKKARKKPKAKKSAAEETLDETVTEDTAAVEAVTEDITAEDAVNQKVQKESGSSQIKQFFSAFLAKCRNIKYTIQGICDKIKKAAENAAYYKGILESALFKETFALCKKQLAFLWKHCKPKKLRLFVCVGTSDPALLGNIISLYGMLYPFVVNHVMLQPEFDKEILEGSLFTKGHITVFWLLKTAWILYFNKNIKRLRKLFQKEEV